MKRERILGIPYNNISENEILSRCENFFRDEGTHTIVFLSLILLMKARKLKGLRVFLEEADLIIPTGRYIFRAARMLKHPIETMIDPSGLVKQLLVQSVSLNKKVYFFGSNEETIEEAYRNLKKEITRLFVIGKHGGKYRPIEHDDIVAAIGKASPDYFFIGLGSPREEWWVIQNRAKINAKIVIFVEGLFGIFSGKTKRRYSMQSSSLDKIVYNEIPHPHSILRLFYLVPFFILVLFERLFWKR